MSYQVLARKWRPRTFSDFSGQSHIVKALSYALNQHRLHQAYLFTGTRGVGKTTLARLMAKAVNCERGISANPCLVCDACLSIERGEYLDLIEIDAASRTRVEDTRSLLDNVPYMPSLGRYKVYLIDEVHMLSSHSFNALLKTLEEPPPHVIFILATTEPERLPITILSRTFHCSLHPISVEAIVERLGQILVAEAIPFELEALVPLASHVGGSLRDALTALDQLIALGEGRLSLALVSEFLGGVSQQDLQAFYQALLDQDSEFLLRKTAQWAEEGCDFKQLFDQLLSFFHREMLVHLGPSLKDDEGTQLQLFYQICLQGKRDLPYAPTPRIGFEVTVLRLLAFELAPPLPHQSLALKGVDSPSHSTLSCLKDSEVDWLGLIPQLNCQGVGKLLAENCGGAKLNGNEISLNLHQTLKHLLTALSQDKLTLALTEYYQRPICVKIELTSEPVLSFAQEQKMKEEAQQMLAKQTMASDPKLQLLTAHLEAVWDPKSIQMIEKEDNIHE